MNWYHYIACFFSGLLLTNAVPHFVHGISGNSFPTPFAKPPGKGLSSPMVNVLWALANLIIGYVLLIVGKVSQTNIWTLLTFFGGVVFISIMLSITFSNKMH